MRTVSNEQPERDSFAGHVSRVGASPAPFRSRAEAVQQHRPGSPNGIPEGLRWRQPHTAKTTMLGVVSLVWRQVMSWSWSALLVAFMVVGGLLALPVVAKHSRARRLKLSAGRGGIRFEYEGEPPAKQPDDRQDDDPA